MANRFKNSTTKVGQLLHRFCKRYVVGYEYEPYLTQNLKTVATFRYPSPGSTPVPAANDGDEKEWEFKTSRVQRTESVQEGTELDESNAFWPLKAVGKCTHQPLPLRFRKPHLYQENLDVSRCDPGP